MDRIDHRGMTGLSEEHGGGGDHREHPQSLPPLDPHERHDDHIKDVFRTRAEFESKFRRAEGARSVELGDNSLGAVDPLELFNHP